MMNKKKLYLAGALHHAWQRQYLDALARELEPHYEVFLPHRDGGRFISLVKSGMPIDDAAVEVHSADVAAIRASHVLLAVAFGKHFSDAGVCFEVGYAMAERVPCYALAPDLDLSPGFNPMLRASFRRIFSTWAELTPITNLATKETK
jgi:nucleoside 2-deoxyribosyltransferase